MAAAERYDSTTIALAIRGYHAPVAQLDRASAYEAGVGSSNLSGRAISRWYLLSPRDAVRIDGLQFSASLSLRASVSMRNRAFMSFFREACSMAANRWDCSSSRRSGCLSSIVM